MLQLARALQECLRDDLERGFGERGVEALPCSVEVLGHDAGFGDDGEEVGVAGPAWQGVHVEVAGNSGTGSLAEVEAHVDAVGLIDFAEDGVEALRPLDDFARGGWRLGVERVEMIVGNDHGVAGGVGEGVEDNKAEWAAGDDADGAVGGLGRHAVVDGVGGGGDHVAEQAAGVTGPGGEFGRHSGAYRLVVGDVGVAPRGPEPIHAASIATIEMG